MFSFAISSHHNTFNFNLFAIRFLAFNFSNNVFYKFPQFWNHIFRNVTKFGITLKKKDKNKNIKKIIRILD